MRRATLRWRRKAQRAGAAGRANAGLVDEFKEARRKLKRAIGRSKDEKWREFCATLEQDPWRRPYRVIRAKMTSNGPPESLSRDRVARILDDLFVTSRTEQTEDGHGSRILQTQEEELRDLCVTEDDLRPALEKCNPKKAAGMEGVPRQVVKMVADQRPGRFLDLFNSIYKAGRIPAAWKVAGVVLLPKPARDPLLSSSYRPMSILPAMSKVWEHTCKIQIERCLGRDPFHREQCGFRRRSKTMDALNRVCGIADLCRRRGLVCVPVAVDIRNAFNTLSWKRILVEAEERRLPGQLLRILRRLSFG